MKLPFSNDTTFIVCFPENLTLHSGASLILHEFRAEESGRYTCSISFTEEDQLHTITFSHTVVGEYIPAVMKDR